MRLLWAVGLFSLLCCGCVRTAVVQFWQPAAIDVGHVNRIAVTEFSGDQGRAVTSALRSRLYQNEFEIVSLPMESGREYHLVSHSRGDDAEDRFQQLLASARKERAEGILTGSVIEYRCEDRHARKAIVSEGPGEGKQSFLPSAARSRESREILIREGVVTIEFRLVDAETGDVTFSKRFTHRYSGEGPNDGEGLPTQTEVLNDLTQQCLTDVMAMLAPQAATAEIQLANCDVWTRGRREVKEGNRLAEAGKWKEAVEHWEAALAISPNNHAALFNLAIAADHRQEYDVAEELAMQALRLQHKTCYTDGLAKIREHRNR
jgi:tetratricopeptide (TPR) repeat protein